MRCGREILHNPVIDTLALSRYLFPKARAHRLGDLCRNFEVTYDEEGAHRADYDAGVLNEVWQPMIVLLNKEHPGITHEDLGSLQVTPEHVVHFRPVHVCALAKDKEGLKELYKLVSLSHVEYFSDIHHVPIVPKSAI